VDRCRGLSGSVNSCSFTGNNMGKGKKKRGGGGKKERTCNKKSDQRRKSTCCSRINEEDKTSRDKRGGGGKTLKGRKKKGEKKKCKKKKSESKLKGPQPELCSPREPLLPGYGGKRDDGGVSGGKLSKEGQLYDYRPWGKLRGARRLFGQRLPSKGGKKR